MDQNKYRILIFIQEQSTNKIYRIKVRKNLWIKYIQQGKEIRKLLKVTPLMIKVQEL